MQEKGVQGKNKIKERFNELAQQVTIDTSEFMNALLNKKKKQTEEEEVKLDAVLAELPHMKNDDGPSMQEGDTLESTPTPLSKAKSQGEAAGSVENMLDNIDQINL